MSTTYIDRCPYCGKVFYNNNRKRPKYFGRAYINCSSCHKKFIDSNAFEWENLNNQEKKFILSYPLLGMVIQERIKISSEKEIRANLLWTIPLSFLIIGIPQLIEDLNTLKILKKFKFSPDMLENSTIQASIKRTSDLAYRKMLLDSGKYFYGIDYKE